MLPEGSGLAKVMATPLEVTGGANLNLCQQYMPITFPFTSFLVRTVITRLFEAQLRYFTFGTKVYLFVVYYLRFACTLNLSPLNFDKLYTQANLSF